MEQCKGKTNFSLFEIKCLICGKMVEVFSDEPKGYCECGASVFNNKLTCKDWCEAQEKCDVF